LREESGKNQMLYISKVREYMEIEYQNRTNVRFPFNLERILDDFMFLTVFLGNDFIPEQTGIDVHGGYFDRVIEIYQETLTNECNDYLIYAGRVNWAEAEKLFAALAEYQISIFRDVWSTQIDLLMDRDNLLKHKIVLEGF
jgi:5'-3' exoribonuclease 2